MKMRHDMTWPSRKSQGAEFECQGPGLFDAPYLHCAVRSPQTSASAQHARRVRRAALIPACVLALTVITGGCTNHHRESTNTANLRWLTMRSAQLLGMARQQFEMGDLDQADKTVENSLMTDPMNAHLMVMAARIALERGRLERSYHLLNKAIEIDSELPSAHYYQGLVMQRWQQFDAALVRYQNAYGLEADNVAYLLAVGEMLVAIDRVDDALELLEAKLAYFEQNAGIREAVGRLYVMQDKFTKAVDFFHDASLLLPDDLQIQEELGLTQLEAEQFEDAIRTLEPLCEEFDLRDRRYLRLALISAYQAAGHSEKAWEKAMAMTRRAPDDIEAWRLVAELAWDAEDLTAALSAAGRVSKLAPQQPEGFLLAGMVWQKRGQSHRALKLFEQAVKVDRSNANAVILQGIVLEDMGRWREAAEAYREALRRQPDDPRAQELLTRLATADVEGS